MRFRRVTLLVVIYLALDFANPMMPGAVQLVEGSIEMVAGCQARTAEDAGADSHHYPPTPLDRHAPTGAYAFGVAGTLRLPAHSIPLALPRTARAAQHARVVV